MKYEFTGEIKVEFGITLKRIRRLSDGLIGGWIEKGSNLSQDGSCFVFGDAQVFGNARVSGNVWVFGNARVYGDARVFGDVQVYGDARVFGTARVYGNAWVYGDARVFGDVQVYGDARVSGDARVFGTARVYGNAWVSQKTTVTHSDDLISIIGIRFSVTITLTGINIGCKEYINYDDFISRYKKEGKENSYKDFELVYLKDLIYNSLKLLTLNKENM